MENLPAQEFLFNVIQRARAVVQNPFFAATCVPRHLPRTAVQRIPAIRKKLIKKKFRKKFVKPRPSWPVRVDAEEEVKRNIVVRAGKKMPNRVATRIRKTPNCRLPSLSV